MDISTSNTEMNISPKPHESNTPLSPKVIERLKKEMGEYNKFWIENKKKDFTPECWPIRSWVEAVNRGLYDLNPPHQRNVIHNDKWKSAIIDSIIIGRPIGNPEFDTVKNPITGLRKKRSLDGKQRGMAPVGLVNNDYIYKGCIESMKGKYFRDMPQIWKDHILDQKISIFVTQETLSDKEVTEHFRLKQETKKTSTGEKLNSVLSQRTNHCRTIARRVSYGGDAEDLRKNALELVVRLCYIQSIFGTKSNDPKSTVLIKFLENDEELPEEEKFKQYEIFINNLFSIIKETRYPHKWKKTFVLPLAALNLTYVDEIEKIKVFVQNEIHDNTNFYDLVGGSHGATNSRIVKLKKKYDDWRKEN